MMIALGFIIGRATSAEKADLALLGTSITGLLAAFASGNMTPAQAGQVLAEINAEDATIQTQNAAIQAAIAPPAPAAPAAPAA